MLPALVCLLACRSPEHRDGFLLLEVNQGSLNTPSCCHPTVATQGRGAASDQGAHPGKGHLRGATCRGRTRPGAKAQLVMFKRHSVEKAILRITTEDDRKQL